MTEGQKGRGKTEKRLSYICHWDQIKEIKERIFQMP